MLDSKINVNYIKQFEPCDSGVKRYLDAGYENFNGNIIEFLELENISFADKKWVVFHESQKILSDNLMREFALLCALRAVERADIPEITYIYDIALLEHVSGIINDSEAYYAARSNARSNASSAASSEASSEAYYAAKYASYYAAYSTAEEKIQLNILINLIEDGITLK